MALLSIDHVTKRYPISNPLFRRRRDLFAVDDVSLDVSAGKTTGVVGESGCGKSTTARLALGLERPDAGRVLFEGAPLPAIGSPAWRVLRRQMQMVYQDPLNALDRRMTVLGQVAEPLEIHEIAAGSERRNRAIELLRAVGLRVDQGEHYPHELSGGQRQRVVLARALASHPRILVCDEPVSALDVSIQAQIINLLVDLQAQFGVGILFISHDLRVIRHISHEIVVMYLGKVVEQGKADDVIETPAHPYTRALVAAMPTISDEQEKFAAPIGELPDPSNRPTGCAYHPRCPLAQSICKETTPELATYVGNRRVACHFAGV